MIPSLVTISAAFLVLALLFAALERLWPSIPTRSCWRPGAGTDLVYWFFTPFVTKSITRFGTTAALIALAVASGVPFENKAFLDFLARPTRVSSLPVAVQIVLALLAIDFISYWMHRLFHEPRLWKFHAIHHGSTNLDWLSAVRVHPVNDLVMKLASLVPLFWLGFRPGALAGVVPIVSFYAILVHANVPWSFGPLRYVIASPRFHRWHHTSEDEGLNKNFAGLFPFFDLTFGTFYMPEGRQPEKFGVAGEPIPETIGAQLVYPFRHS